MVFFSGIRLSASEVLLCFFSQAFDCQPLRFYCGFYLIINMKVFLIFQVVVFALTIFAFQTKVRMKKQDFLEAKIFILW